MQIFSILLDILNLIAFFFSLQLVLNRIVSGLSLLSVLAFSSILALEYFRKRDIEYIMNEPPPLDRHDLFMLTFKNSGVKNLKEAEIEEWKIEKQKEAQEKSATYLNWEKTLLVIGIIITLVITYFLFFP